MLNMRSTAADEAGTPKNFLASLANSGKAPSLDFQNNNAFSCALIVARSEYCLISISKSSKLVTFVDSTSKNIKLDELFSFSSSAEF